MSDLATPNAHPRKKPGPQKGDPRMVEAGRRGGARVRETHGASFFQQIGQKGGQATRARHGSDFFADIGRKGGQAVKQERGIDYYAAIGRKGGTTPSGKRA